MKKTPTVWAVALLSAVTTACSSPELEANSSTASFEVVLAADVAWEHLNPARGDKAPQAGTLWGDRNGSEPTGFLLRPSDGFRSPPHIHNVSYRGVVIRGLLHNDDPSASEQWLPAGSFWTQPKGHVHITAAKGANTLAYIEIEAAPYRVLPVAEAFDSGEVPINVDASNLVWLDAPNGGENPAGAKVAYVWGDPQDGKLNGSLLKLPAGFSGTLRSHGASLRAVVIQGQAVHQPLGKADAKTLDPGSYFSSQGAAGHEVSCAAECVVYLRAEGTYDVLGTARR